MREMSPHGKTARCLIGAPMLVYTGNNADSREDDCEFGHFGFFGFSVAVIYFL